MGLKDLIFCEEKPINGESQYRLINYLTKDEIDRIAWSLEYEGIKIIDKAEEKEIRK